MLKQTIYLDRDNEILLQLLSNGEVIDHSLITRVVLKAPGITIDSNTYPLLFDFTQATKFGMTLGSVNMSPGVYPFRLTVYDPVNTNGVSWEPVIQITVRET